MRRSYKARVNLMKRIVNMAFEETVLLTKLEPSAYIGPLAIVSWAASVRSQSEAVGTEAGKTGVSQESIASNQLKGK
jgi:hypothetical protein